MNAKNKTPEQLLKTLGNLEIELRQIEYRIMQLGLRRDRASKLYDNHVAWAELASRKGDEGEGLRHEHFVSVYLQELDALNEQIRGEEADKNNIELRWYSTRDALKNLGQSVA